jgi:16S rRNA A1518/A1519 N6-dimethyltransferase RsmA/KsgA/DIM1 with predicted DNA glycosylase/AP lyase activity
MAERVLQVYRQCTQETTASHAAQTHNESTSTHSAGLVSASVRRRDALQRWALWGVWMLLPSLMAAQLFEDAGVMTYQFGETLWWCVLPYAIATPWLDEVLAGPLPSRLVLMLQQEAAQRYAAAPGSKSFGAISVFLQAAYDIAPGHKVAAACFFPRPDVESHLLNLVRKPAPFVFPEPVKALVRSCFQQRRKQLGALLRGRLPDDFPAETWRSLLQAEGLTEQARPEAVPVSWWVRFAPHVPPLA